jgi:sphinganine-1-phosphate aldolase
MKIPNEGLSKDAVLKSLEAAREGDWPWREGKLFAYVFDGGKEIEEVGKLAHAAYASENGLDPTTFPSLLRFENEIVDMARRHLGGGEAVVGNFTSGGTESIILAVKTARDWFRAHRPEVDVPEMIVPITAHAAFHKAGHYLGVKVVTTAVDPKTYKADVEAMRAAMNEKTMLLVASACSYAHGVIDPVAPIAAMAKKAGLLCHVDGCMGGFLLPYFRRLGQDVPDFDFRVPGVSSMSMDFHKYGLCPKGASVVLYRDEALRKFQLYACSEWTGYTLINTTIQSSKSGGPLAAAWAVLQFVGDAGYLKIAKELRQSRDELTRGVAQIPGLAMMGVPEMSLIAFTSDEISVFALADELQGRGWRVQAQLGHGPSKENIHLTIAPSNTKWTGDFLEALRQSVAAVRAAGGGPKAPTEMAAMIAAQLEADTSGASLQELLAGLVGPGGSVPGKMADINALLNALPRSIQKQLLIAFVGKMFTPKIEA